MRASRRATLFLTVCLHIYLFIYLACCCCWFRQVCDCYFFLARTKFCIVTFVRWLPKCIRICECATSCTLTSRCIAVCTVLIAWVCVIDNRTQAYALLTLIHLALLVWHCCAFFFVRIFPSLFSLSR